MINSASTHTITWTQPDPKGEQWEFFNHPAKQEFYRRNGISWEQIVSACNHGRMEPYPRNDRICGIPVALSYHRYEDYTRYLARARRGYRLNYTKMEDALQCCGTLVLPSPIILQCNGEALLFSGYRRLCLAWNYGMVPAVWLATLG